MQEDGSDRVLSRLEEVERRLREAVIRLEAIEGRQHAPVPPVPPPPRIEPSPAPIRTERPYESPQPVPTLQVQAPLRTTALAEDAEFSVGARLLPRFGAFLVLLGIGYLIGIGITHGWITPWMQFAGAVLLCAAFIAVGAYKLNEREEFGHLLIGIGSCGLYITFVGGHLYQHIYGKDVLVVLFLALSLSNLAFCFWRAAQSFLAIGIVGGISAALMPLGQSPETVPPLHFLVVIPAMLIAAKNRWPHWTLMIWLASMAAPVAYFATKPPWLQSVMFLYVSSGIQIALAMLTYPFPKARSESRVFAAEDFDSDGYFPAVAVVITMLIAFAMKFQWLHLLGFTASLWAICAFLPKDNVHRQRVLSWSITTLLVLGPATLVPERASIWYSIEAICCALFSILRAQKPFAVVAYCLWSISLYAYVMSFADGQATEMYLLGLAIVAGVVVTGALRKAQYMPVEFTIVSSIIGLILISRVGQLTLGSETWTLTLAWSIYATMLLFTGFALKERELRILGLAIFGIAALKVLTVDISEVAQSYRALVLLVLGLAMLSGGYWYIRTRQS